MKKFVISSVCLAVIAACGQTDDRPEESRSADVAKTEKFEEMTNAEAPEELGSGIDKSTFDMDVRPQDNFFEHVNGEWLESFQIPADKSNYGAFTLLAEKAREDVRNIIEESAGKAEPGSDAAKVGDLYQSYMDTETIEKVGVSPLQPEFNRIDSFEDHEDVAAYMSHLDILGSAPFGVFVQVDAKNSTRYITHFWQSGLGLPDRDYYTEEDEKSGKIREQYVQHIAKMFELAGLEKPEESAKTIMALESRLAEHHRTRVENRDADKRYNLMTFEEVKASAPEFDWDAWLPGTTISESDMQEIVVGQPEYIEAFGDIFKETSVEDWQTYFKWHMLTNAAPFLNQALDDENFNFFQGVLSGVEEQEPRWKRAVNVINGTVGELVGKVYVARHFSPEAKSRMEDLVENLRKAYAIGIDELEWMGEDTKKQAKEKLAKFTPKIGYPDKWKDYSDLETSSDDLIGNMRNATLFLTEYNRSKLGKPIDRTEWFMNPQTVNAYYNPTMNEIVFPAAILQPPFFNLEAEDAVNYGGIGAVIGHEMGHGFDDQGSKFDGDGNLRNWWTDQDREEFEKRTNKLVEQYNDFTVLDGIHVNGEFTQGENIGDLGGMTIAYKAYQLSLDGEESPVIDGYTGEQRFFLGWAQVWRRKYRDEELAKRIKTDPHSPSEFRANGTVQNMPEFYEAFDVKEGDEMYISPEQRVKIW